MQKINETELENVSGGVIFNASQIMGSTPGKPWEVLDNNDGHVIDRYATRQEAEKRAKEFGNCPANAIEYNWDQVRQLRGQK